MYLTLKYKLTKSLINCKISNCKINFGLIAQLVERRVRNAEARGSNPLKSTTFPLDEHFGLSNGFLYVENHAKARVV